MPGAHTTNKDTICNVNKYVTRLADENKDAVAGHAACKNDIENVRVLELLHQDARGNHSCRFGSAKDAAIDKLVTGQSSDNQTKNVVLQLVRREEHRKEEDDKQRVLVCAFWLIVARSLIVILLVRKNGTL